MSKKAFFCSPRDDNGERAAVIGPELQSLLEKAGDERTLQDFLNTHPEVVGWRFSWGTSPTLVLPQFRLGSEFVPDFLVIDSPQWVDLYLIEIESPSSSVFNADGTYSKRLAQAVKQTTEWRQWIADNRQYLRDRLLELVDAVIEPLRDDEKPYYTHFLRSAVERGDWQLKTGVVIGRRSSYGDRGERLRRGFLESTKDVALFSFDALVDTCHDRFA